MSQMLRDKLTYALELVDGSKDNPECNSQMLWNDQHSYLRFLLVDCIRLVDLKQDIRDMANERTCQNCLNAHKPEWCGYGVNTCENFELDDWISVKVKLPKLGQFIKVVDSDGDEFYGECNEIRLAKDAIDIFIFGGNHHNWAYNVGKWQPLPDNPKFIARPGKKCVTLSYNGYEYCCPSPTNSWECEVDMVGLVDWLNGVVSAADK